MMKLLPKMMLWIIASLVLLVVLAGAVNVGVDYYQYHKNQQLIERISPNQQPSKTLVVFFSHSGNTELMARKIAELTKADVLPLQSKRNQVGVLGLLEAVQDAHNTNADIVPNQVDLSRYDTIYIGSPVWLYSPATQVYQFAKSNDFSDKTVFLFNSMNSKFEQRFIDEFKHIVENNGGTFAKHPYIIRGRMGQQMSSYEFLKETEKLVP